MPWEGILILAVLVLIPGAAMVASFGYGIWTPWLGFAGTIAEAYMLFGVVWPIWRSFNSGL